MISSFKTWFEAEVPMVNGVPVHSPAERDAALAQINDRVSKREVWNVKLDPNYKFVYRQLLAVLPKSGDRNKFWAADYDSVWQLIMRPLFKRTVTAQELRDAVQKMANLKLVRFTGEEGEDYFTPTANSTPTGAGSEF